MQPFTMRSTAFLTLATGAVSTSGTNWEAPPANYAFADYKADFAKSYASPEEAAAKEAAAKEIKRRSRR